MKKMSLGCGLILIVILSLACNGKSATQTLQATEDIQAAVKTSVAATVTAMPPAPTPMPTEAYGTLSEEEMAAAVDASIQEVATTAAQASSSVAVVAADGEITEQELVLLYANWVYTDELIAYTDDLIAAYSEVYGELAAESLTLLQAVQADLDAISRQMEVLIPVLDQVSQTLDQDSADILQVLSQLEVVIQTTQVSITDAQAQAQAWSIGLPVEMQSRVDQALAVQPQQIAETRLAAIQSAFDYVDSVRAALADQKVTQAELAEIAQLGADATASLTAQSGSQIATLAGSINQITMQLAGGQYSNALSGLANFQAALPSRP